MRRFAGLASSVLETEMALHREFAARWGVTDLEAVQVEPATAAYSNFLLRTASWATSPSSRPPRSRACGRYAEIGATLRPASERYREWIDMYASAEFGALAAWARSIVDERGWRRGPDGRGVRGVLRARGQVLGCRLRRTCASPRLSVTFAASK